MTPEDLKLEKLQLDESTAEASCSSSIQASAEKLKEKMNIRMSQMQMHLLAAAVDTLGINAEASEHANMDKEASAAVDVKTMNRNENAEEGIIRRVPFIKMVFEITEQMAPGFSCSRVAIRCLRELAEAFLVSEFEDANLVAIGQRRITIKGSDMEAVNQARVMRGGRDLRPESQA